MREAALTLDGISAGYGGTDVLRGVSLTVARGEMLGVLGPNGAGKSTLIRVASGVMRPRAGSVCASFGGVLRELSAVPPRVRARTVAVLPQEGAPAFPVTTLSTVLLGRTPWHDRFVFESDEDVAAAEAALRDVDALDLRDRELSQLSGGERQRVLLARALCQGGDVLLCDEPTAHLDLRHQEAVFLLLRRLADAGRAVLVATHDIDLAAALCDRLLLLGGDGVVASGTPQVVVTSDHLQTAFGIRANVRMDQGTPRIERTLLSRTHPPTKEPRK